MSVVNPNTLTPTRIPSAYLSTILNYPADNILRKISDSGTRSRIVMGPKKGYQYLPGENWRSGLTPFDNGYYNDGISTGHDPSPSPSAPSRYYDSNDPNTLFEWWGKYIIYCSGGNTTGPNGNDNLEIFVANDVTELIETTNKLIGSSVTSERQALEAIAGNDEIMCVNTHYPNIPISDSVGLNGATYSLRLLHDFGFTGCFPRGGTKSYDISNNINHNMSFTSNTNITYEPETNPTLNCLGGCLKMTNQSSLDYGYIPYDVTTSFYSQNTTVSTWVQVNTTGSNRCIIDTTGGWVSGAGSGYQLWISGNQVALIVLTLSGVFTWTSSAGLISADRWYNIIFSISTDPGNSNTDVNVVISSESTFSIESNSGSAAGGQGGNTNDFVIGVKNGTPKSNPFNSYISLVSVYEGALSTFGDMQQLWSAYAQCTPKPFTSPNGGRYLSY